MLFFFFFFFSTTLEEKKRRRKKKAHLLSLLATLCPFLSSQARHYHFFQLIYLATNEPRTKCDVLYCTYDIHKLWCWMLLRSGSNSVSTVCANPPFPPPHQRSSGLSFHVNHCYIGYIARFLSSNEHKSSYHMIPSLSVRR